MNKNRALLLVLIPLTAEAMQVVEVHSDGESHHGETYDVVISERARSFERVKERAMAILDAKEDESIRAVKDSITDLTQQIEELAHNEREADNEADSVQQATIERNLVVLKNVRDDMRVLWAQKVTKLTAMNEHELEECVEYCTTWAMTVADAIPYLRYLEISSCINVLDTIIRGLKHSERIVGTLSYTVEKEWGNYLKRIPSATPECVEYVARIRSTIAEASFTCEALVSDSTEESFFQQAIHVKDLVDELVRYLQDGSNPCEDNYVPQVEKDIERIIIHIQSVFDCVHARCERWKRALKVHRDHLRRTWAEHLLTSASAEDAIRKCIASLELLHKELTTEDQIALTNYNVVQEKLTHVVQELAEAQEYTLRATQRRDEAVAYRDKVLERIETRPTIKDHEGSVEYRPALRALDRGNSRIEQSEAVIAEKKQQIQELLQGICQERLAIIEATASDNPFSSDHHQRTAQFFENLSKMVEAQLNEKICQLYRDKEGIKNDFTEEEFISLSHLQQDAFTQERIAERILKEELRRQDKRESLKEQLEELMGQLEQQRRVLQTDSDEITSLISRLRNIGQPTAVRRLISFITGQTT